MKSKVKQEKGVTLIVLVITVIALTILTFTITVNTKNSAEIKRLSQLKSDIANLNQKVSDFYNKYGEIPASIEYTNTSGLQEILNNKEKSADSKFYVVDLQAMKSISLNYGQDYESVKGTNAENANNYKDLYIINNLTHNIFYVDGVSVTENGQSKVYYTNYDVPADVPDIDLSVKYTNVDTSKTNPAEATPDNVVVIEDDANKGITIKDENYNEWVWVEVPKDTVFSGLTIDTTKELTEQNYTDIKNKMIDYAKTYREGKLGQGCDWTDEWYDGCGLTSEEYTASYQKMLKSVYKYGGFWIGRYEAGIDGSIADLTKIRTSHSAVIVGTSPKAISQKDAIPYNYVYCSEAQALAKEMATDNNCTSSLMFGIQWDLVCKYLEVKGGLTEADINQDSSSWGNYSSAQIENIKRGKYFIPSIGTWTQIVDSYIKQNSQNNNMILLSTGIAEYTNKMNIYDFSGNEWEWTLEKAPYTDGPCGFRGGSFYHPGVTYPAASRGNNTILYAPTDIAFRVTIYK